MLKVRAVQKHIRISPRKLRLVANFLSGLKFNEAIDQLKYLPNKGARWAEKVLFSAMYNAENNHGLRRDNLYIESAIAEEGMRLKRWRPVSRGMAHSFIKPSSHLKIILAEIKESKSQPKKLSADLAKGAKKDAKQIKKIVQKEKPGKEIFAKKSKIESKTKKIFDKRRRGKHRSNQHLDKIVAKKTGGMKKQIFRRKAV